MEIIHLTPEDTTKSLLKEGNAVFTEKTRLSAQCKQC